jgi:hypothetical protein
MLPRITQSDHERALTLIAVVRERELAGQIGLARYVINRDGESAG